MVDTEIGKSTHAVFRRAFIKRRNALTGLYESDWLNITDFVKKWGTINSTIDDVSLNNFRHSGIRLTVRNDGGDFNDENNVNSLFFGWLTRFRTLLRIDAGYVDAAGDELPTNATQGIFILTNDVTTSAKRNESILNFKSLVSVFDEVLSTDVAGLGTTQTSSDIVTKIRDHTDGSSNVIFRQFISASSWTIHTTTTNLNLATSTSLDGLSCWELMNKLAEAEGYILVINRSGGFEFRDRDERTTTSAFTLNGQGYRKQSVISLDGVIEPINKYYNFFRLKYLEPDTSTSFVTAGTTTSVDPSSTAWKYGVRRYEFENLFLPDTATAQGLVNARRNQFDDIKEELKITCKILPQLEISDKVTFNYRSWELGDAILWDNFNWDEEDWPDESTEIFEWTGEEFKILSRRTNLDNFTTSLTLRRLSI